MDLKPGITTCCSVKALIGGEGIVGDRDPFSCADNRNDERMARGKLRPFFGARLGRTNLMTLMGGTRTLANALALFFSLRFRDKADDRGRHDLQASCGAA